AVVLLLGAPQQRNNGRGLLAGRIVADRRLGPGSVFWREGKARGLVGGESAYGHAFFCCLSLGGRWRPPYRRGFTNCRGSSGVPLLAKNAANSPHLGSRGLASACSSISLAARPIPKPQMPPRCRQC